MSKKTKASVKDGRLTVFASDARTPSVNAWGLDQVSSGAFEVAPAENEGSALVFKPGGKKAAETVAVYNTAKQAGEALETVFAALNSRGKSNVFASGLKGILKVAGIIVAIILVFSLLSWFFGAPATVPVGAPQSSGELPVGEPFPVNDFVRETNQ